MACPSPARKSGSSNLFGVGPGETDKTALVQELSKAITFYWSYPGKIAHSNSTNRELSNDMSLLEVLPRKVALHTSSHLTPNEAWQSAVSTTSEGCRVLSEVRLENCTQVWGVGQIWTACDPWLRKNSASHLFWLVQTCRKLSEPGHNTVTMYSRSAMSFFCNFGCS